MTAAPGTAALYEAFQRLGRFQDAENKMRRAMMLSWVDEFERQLGYGEKGNRPRTAQIRQYWRDMGEPEL